MLYLGSICIYNNRHTVRFEYLPTDANFYITVYSYFIPTFFGGWYLAPCLAANHFLVGIRLRAMASAILLFVLNLIGLGFGPMLTGLISDFLTPEFGNNGLRYALSFTILINFWCAFHYYFCLKKITKDFD